VTWLASHPSCAFLLRFVVVLGALLAPIPFMADAYTSLWGTFANGALFVADHGSNVGFRFAPPPAIRARGSWEASLRLEDRRSGDTRVIEMNVRNFSYRSVATFVALSVAAAARRFRYLLAVLGGGAGQVLTLVLAAIAAFQQGFGRIYGIEAPNVVRMLHAALTTPVMLYALPLGFFWIASRWEAKRREEIG
jgi:hypothetical protein